MSYTTTIIPDHIKFKYEGKTHTSEYIQIYNRLRYEQNKDKLKKYWYTQEPLLCSCCNYSTKLKSQFVAHLKTKKHQRLQCLE